MIVVLNFFTMLKRAPINKVIVSSAEDGHDGAALGTASTITRLAAVISLAIVSGIFSSSYAKGLHDNLKIVDLDQKAHVAESEMGIIIEIEKQTRDKDAPDTVALEEAVTHAFLNAQRAALLVAAIAAFAGALVSLYGIREQDGDSSGVARTEASQKT